MHLADRAPDLLGRPTAVLRDGRLVPLRERQRLGLVEASGQALGDERVARLRPILHLLVQPRQEMRRHVGRLPRLVLSLRLAGRFALGKQRIEISGTQSWSARANMTNRTGRGGSCLWLSVPARRRYFVSLQPASAPSAFANRWFTRSSSAAGGLRKPEVRV